jgi:UDP-N-acetylmuramoyl-tripeptide--D-alanyl-D-alanine ligase
MRPLRGIRSTVVIDDTYNASPVALESALETLANLPCEGRRVVVLGDMLDLGEYSVKAHEQIGEKVASFAHAFFAVGVRMQKALEIAKQKNPHLQYVFCKDSREAGKKVEEYLGSGDVVLVKGSQSLRMERAVEVLLANPEDRALLPRRGKEWEKR